MKTKNEKRNENRKKKILNHDKKEEELLFYWVGLVLEFDKIKTIHHHVLL